MRLGQERSLNNVCYQVMRSLGFLVFFAFVWFFVVVWVFCCFVLVLFSGHCFHTTRLWKTFAVAALR